MNRFLLHISWIDAKVINQTLTSIENAMAYSTVPTEFVVMLNEQTFIDTPLEKTPKQQWEYFIDHPFLKKCQIITKTDEDDFWGVCRMRREFLNKEGITYWGESDCMVPLEYFYLAENLDKSLDPKQPFLLSFAVRKMWEGWEIIEHVSLRGTKLEDYPQGNFMRCSSPINGLDKLYEFNEKQGDPTIILLPRPRVEGAGAIMKNLPDNILCPTLDFFHDDFNLELLMPHFNIPQYHVENLIKGHDNGHPEKRSNIADPNTRNPKAIARKDKNYADMIAHVKKILQVP